MGSIPPLQGERIELTLSDELYPDCLRGARNPPERIFIIGSLSAVREGLAVIGARKATAYGIEAAKRFARIAAEHGIPIISGGARGCDSASHRAAIECAAITVSVLGGGLDRIYPRENRNLFQSIIDGGGALISEHPWNEEPRPYYFRARNRIIAGMARATLIVEAGIPSGTFSTADEALERGKSVLAVPGSITSRYSMGANTLIYQGATPIVDDDVFLHEMRTLFGIVDMAQAKAEHTLGALEEGTGVLLDSLRADAMTLEEMMPLAQRCAGDEVPTAWLLSRIATLQSLGFVQQSPDGRYISVR